MHQELLIDGDHEEMVANWIAESDPCPNCNGTLDNCSTCDGIGRVSKEIVFK